MSASVIIGNDPHGTPVSVDVRELLATRLLVQGNSGSGKSHLLRRLLEESAAIVQQVVIDPEGDFTSLAGEFGHVVIDAAAYSDAEITRLGERIRRHRASVVLALDGLEIDQQMRCAATFLNALFDAPREHWHPALVVVDEAQMFAPAAAGEVSEDARRASLAAMTNLMCRGRKRGLAGVIATQRLAKLAKNVAAEASNFLMGRTFLDIDMQRAADLLGMERRQAEAIRDLERGQFLGLGPAIARRPIAVRVGAVRTGIRVLAQDMAPLPQASAEELHALLHNGLQDEPEAQPPRASPRGLAAETLLQQVAAMPVGITAPIATEQAAVTRASSEDTGPAIDEILAEMAREDGVSFQPMATLQQDFSVRCRMRAIAPNSLDATQFRRRFAMALAGISNPLDERWADILQLCDRVPDEVLAPLLLIARAAQEGRACPSDNELAQAYGTSSKRRILRLLDYLEKEGLVVVRTDYAGNRSIAVPELGLSTAPVDG